MDLGYWFVLKDLMLALNQKDMVSTAYIIANSPGYAPEFKEYCRGWVTDDRAGMVSSSNISGVMGDRVDCGEAAGVDGD